MHIVERVLLTSPVVTSIETHAVGTKLDLDDATSRLTLGEWPALSLVLASESLNNEQISCQKRAVAIVRCGVQVTRHPDPCDERGREQDAPIGNH